MPKCASTALEAALASQMDVVISRNPAAKHTPFRKYDRFLRRYLETYTDGPLEVVSLFREPVDWLRSWWRYRSRDGLADSSRSAKGWTFDQFAQAYLSGQRGPASVGSQARFVSTRDGSLGVDRIFRYESIRDCAAYLSDRLASDVVLDRLNVSPPPPGSPDLDEQTRLALSVALEPEFRIYRDVAR
jgi:hypothetical protein